MPKIGSLLLGIGADVSDLVAGSKEANEALSSIGKQARSLATEMVKAGAAATAAALAASAAFVKSGLDSIDAQAKLARALDASINGLRTLQLAADDAGVSNEELTTSLRLLNVRLGDAQKGTGAAYEALRALGLSARDLADMDADERVATIARRINELGLSGSQAADLLRDLGIKNENLVTLIRSGGDAFDTAAQKLKAYGLELSDIDAAKVEAAGDAIDEMKLAFEAVRNNVTLEFAPVIQALAQKFNELSKANGGFGEMAVNVAQNVMLGFARVGDVIQGLRVVVKGIELVFTGAGATLVTVIQGAVEVIRVLVDAVISDINRQIEGVNKLGLSIDTLPLMDQSDFMQSVRQFGDQARGEVSRVRGELSALAEEELPSAKVERFFNDVKARAQEAATAAANASKAMRDDAGNSSFDPEAQKRTDDILANMPQLDTDAMLRKLNEDNEKKFTAEREALQKRLDMIREYTQTELEEENAKQQQRLDAARQAFEFGLLQEDSYKATVERLEQTHAEKVKDIRTKNMTDLQKFAEASFGSQVKTAVGAFAQITAGISQQSKIAFEVNKIAGIANVIIKGIESVQNAYAWGSAVGGPYGGAAAAAIAAAVSAANLIAIKNASFSGSSGSAPSLAGSTPAPPVTPVSQQAPASRGSDLLVVEGVSADSLFTGRVVRDLAMKLSDFTRDGGSVQFA